MREKWKTGGWEGAQGKRTVHWDLVAQAAVRWGHKALTPPSDVDSQGFPPSPVAHTPGRAPPVGTAASAAAAGTQPRGCQE